ncbi:unnamed protein product [Bursaphelenchus xylophilus]|uniref:(pine wood nematode) hypothetical protein n=1 Tax=Bursaphelenchus xylophilus TaxID=6326 RepID=A0A1I7S002_BURXY|nr:unnamed protein product [Bursaphelenchus xylophilus]CAG9109114.1 unnamed protein product [Bursaphelenchus xylophilus]
MKKYLAWNRPDPAIASSPPPAIAFDFLALRATGTADVHPVKSAVALESQSAAAVADSPHTAPESPATGNPKDLNKGFDENEAYKLKLANFFQSVQQNQDNSAQNGANNMAAALLAAAQKQLQPSQSTATSYLLAAFNNQQAQQNQSSTPVQLDPNNASNSQLNAAIVAAALNQAKVTNNDSTTGHAMTGAQILTACSTNKSMHALSANNATASSQKLAGLMGEASGRHSTLESHPTPSQLPPNSPADQLNQRRLSALDVLHYHQQQASTSLSANLQSSLANSGLGGGLSSGQNLNLNSNNQGLGLSSANNLSIVAAAFANQQNTSQPSVADIYAAANTAVQLQQQRPECNQNACSSNGSPGFSNNNLNEAIVAAAAAAAQANSLQQMVQNSPLGLQQPLSPATQGQQQSQGLMGQNNNNGVAALYPQLIQSLNNWPSTAAAVLLDRLGPQILKSNMPQTQKPIPNFEQVDLAKFKLKEPSEWSMDDVIAWLLDVAKRNSIPAEDLSTQFARCTGAQLLQMNEHQFCERDKNYGSLLYSEFRKLIKDDQCTLDDWIRNHNDTDAGASTSRMSQAQNNALNSLLYANSPLSPLSQQIQKHNSLMSLHSPVSALQQQQKQQNEATLQSFYATHPHLAQQAASNSMSQLQSQQRLQQHHQQVLQQQQQQQILRNIQSQHSPNMNFGQHLAPPMSNGYESSSTLDDYPKVRKNKDGRPRKRSQHTKGNKLWEFIRDALKDPSTCPTIVRWEDPEQGVFRIVESEKLARLWGEKKNNQKMTYEKLSRAMRTYYEKQILVPVPKTGLYPKKLVYKFGPGAHGWTALPHLAQACLRLQQHE